MKNRRDSFQRAFDQHVFPALWRFLSEMDCAPESAEELRRFKSDTSRSLACFRQQVVKYAHGTRMRRRDERRGSNVIPFPRRRQPARRAPD
jgi:hypothetical protein